MGPALQLSLPIRSMGCPVLARVAVRGQGMCAAWRMSLARHQDPVSVHQSSPQPPAAKTEDVTAGQPPAPRGHPRVSEAIVQAPEAPEPVREAQRLVTPSGRSPRQPAAPLAPRASAQGLRAACERGAHQPLIGLQRATRPGPPPFLTVGRGLPARCSSIPTRPLWAVLAPLTS